MADYKKLCEDLRRVYEFHGWNFAKQSADAIEELQAENERLKKQLDDAVTDFRKHRSRKCDCCYYAEHKSEFAPCRDCQSSISNYGDGWLWRGEEGNT